MVLFAHPGATDCVKPFKQLGYQVHIKETPINASQIKKEFLREHVVKSGCCGEKEYLKLYSYTLTDYPIVVHLDLDSLILQPLDGLFDAMIDGVMDSDKSHDANATSASLSVMYNKPVPENIEAFYTKDYNMVHVGHKHPGVQGGFLVLKPNLEYFEEYKRIILDGNFRQGAGWAGKYGGYFGAQQIQGICSYFFEGVHPGTAVELNRCIYNSMVDDPKGPKRKKAEGPDMVCRDGKETCEDCRETDFEKIKSVHFTLCQKPWVCPLYAIERSRLCKDFHTSWFRIRKDWEEKKGIIHDYGTKNHGDVSHGYCSGNGERNYKKIILSEDFLR